MKSEALQILTMKQVPKTGWGPRGDVSFSQWPPVSSWGLWPLACTWTRASVSQLHCAGVCTLLRARLAHQNRALKGSSTSSLWEVQQQIIIIFCFLFLTLHFRELFEYSAWEWWLLCQDGLLEWHRADFIPCPGGKRNTSVTITKTDL